MSNALVMVVISAVAQSGAFVSTPTAAPVPKGGGKCDSPTDCHGGGDCLDRRCVCDPTWTGALCESLHLLPIVSKSPGYPANPPWYDNPTLPTTSTFPWGGAIAQDSSGTYHLFFTEYRNHCPMTFCNTFYTATQISHATAPNATGPWTRKGVTVPSAAGNPALSQAPDGTWLLYFTNHRWSGGSRNCTGPVDTWGPPIYNKAAWPFNKSAVCAAQGPGQPFGISLAYSKSLAGPWEIRYDVITVPATNPGGPVFLPNGTLLLPFQTWTPRKPCAYPECITIVSATAWHAFPYHTFPLGSPPGNDRRTCIERWSDPPWAPYGSVEDPSNIWRDRRGNLHVLMHQASTGGRAWSEDNGTSWHYNYNTTAFSFRPGVDDGSEIDCQPHPDGSRGEPRVSLDPETGLPTVLSTVCFRGDGPGPAVGSGEPQYWSRILLQKIQVR